MHAAVPATRDLHTSSRSVRLETRKRVDPNSSRCPPRRERIPTGVQHFFSIPSFPAAHLVPAVAQEAAHAAHVGGGDKVLRQGDAQAVVIGRSGRLARAVGGVEVQDGVPPAVRNKDHLAGPTYALHRRHLCKRRKKNEEDKARRRKTKKGGSNEGWEIKPKKKKNQNSQDSAFQAFLLSSFSRTLHPFHFPLSSLSPSCFFLVFLVLFLFFVFPCFFFCFFFSFIFILFFWPFSLCSCRAVGHALVEACTQPFPYGHGGCHLAVKNDTKG
jgi:hypothetical protein